MGGEFFERVADTAEFLEVSKQIFDEVTGLFVMVNCARCFAIGTWVMMASVCARRCNEPEPGIIALMGSVGASVWSVFATVGIFRNLGKGKFATH